MKKTLLVILILIFFIKIGYSISCPECYKDSICTCYINCSKGWIRIKLPNNFEFVKYFENGSVSFSTQSIAGIAYGVISCLDNGEENSIEIEIKEKPTVSEKSESMYTTKQAFLVSDENWRDVLPFVPVAVWTGNETWCQRGYGTPSNVCVYPLLIYHREGDAFDADSIIYFFQQYKPDKLILIGEAPEELENLLVADLELGAGFEESRINIISPDNYLSFWKSFDKVVYVEDDYEKALLASTYASLINAPLIIEGTNTDKDEIFQGKYIICVGHVNRNCDETYTIDELQRKYIELTNTDKIILINPNDWNIKVNEEFTPEKSSLSIHDLYSKTSLAAPILASAKHEVIFGVDIEEIPLEIDCSNFKDLLDKINYVDKFVEGIINSTDETFNFLTIISAPNAIPQSFNEQCEPTSWWYNFKNSVDNSYGMSFNKALKTFRIYYVDSVYVNGTVYVVLSIKKDYNHRIFLIKFNISDENTSYAIKDISKDEFLYIFHDGPKIQYASGYLYVAFSGMKINSNKYGIYLWKLRDDGKTEEKIEILSEKIPFDVRLQVKNSTAYLLWSTPSPSGYQEMHYGVIEDNTLKCQTTVPMIRWDVTWDMRTITIEDNFIITYPEIYFQGYHNYSITLHKIILSSECNVLNSSVIFNNTGKIEYRGHDIASRNGNFLMLALFRNLTSPPIHNSFFLLFFNNTYKKIEFEKDDDYEELLQIKENNETLYYLRMGVYENLNTSFGMFYLGKIKNDRVITDELIFDTLNETDLTPVEKNFGFEVTNDSIFLVTVYRPWISFENTYENGKVIYILLKNTKKKIKEIKLFGNINEFSLFTGRIYGIALSDVTSYISRGLFNENIEYLKNTGISAACSFKESRNSTARVTQKMTSAGYEWICLTDEEMEPCLGILNDTHPSQEYFENKTIITFDDHGWYGGWWKTLDYSEIPELKQTFGLGDACSTNNFERGKERTFGVHFLRKGGIGYIGASGTTWLASIQSCTNGDCISLKYADILTDTLLEGKISLGEIFSNLSEKFDVMKTDYLLYGDPTYEVSLE